jgi:virginiamycin A acetyltransferase
MKDFCGIKIYKSLVAFFKHFIYGHFICPESILHNPKRISRGVSIFNSEIGRNSIISRDSLITFSKISKNVSLGVCSRVSSSVIHEWVSLQDYVAIYKSNVSSYSYIARNSLISNTSIGVFCSFAPNIVCGAGMHPTNFISTSPIFYSNKKQCGISFIDKSQFEELPPVVVSADVFVGANSVILNGVKLGVGCVIAAGSVVNCDVEPYAIVGGIPAKIIKMRFNEYQINKLLNSKWWEKDVKQLVKNIDIFSSPIDLDFDLKMDILMYDSKNA